MFNTFTKFNFQGSFVLHPICVLDAVLTVTLAGTSACNSVVVHTDRKTEDKYM
jgi:hypothetical protein